MTSFVKNYGKGLLVFTLIGFFCILTAIQPNLAGADNYCDDNLQPAETNLGYQQLVDRCEGLYVEKKSSVNLQLASFTVFFEDYALDSDQPLIIRWPQFGTGPVQLRASAIDPDFYYRMDTSKDIGAKSFQWDKKFLNSFELKKKDIGVYGWVDHEGQHIFLPLTITQNNPEIEKKIYEIGIIPGGQLDEVYYSLAPLGEDRQPGGYLFQDEELGLGYYPANKLFTIPLTDLPQAGLYQLDIAILFKNGNPDFMTLIFYHE